MKEQKDYRVIPKNRLPDRLPIWSTLTTALALDRWNAPQWLWGALGLFFLLGWIAIMHKMMKQEETDIFPEQKD